MDKPRSTIPYYTEINDLLATLPWPAKSDNPIFYCLKLPKLDRDHKIYRPPFKRSFYFFGLYYNPGNIEIRYDDETVTDPEAYLVCHSPDLTYSFQGNSLEGYTIYFKPECFSFFKPDFHQEFPFFNVLHTNLFKLDINAFKKLAPFFDEVHSTHERSSGNHHLQARIKLLALFYQIKEFVEAIDKTARFTSPQHILLNKYVKLVNNHYINKRTVKEYADLLSITPNHLSQSIKTASGKNALSYISERLTLEAKSLILHTDFDITEIAFQLGFSDPANFGKFFKNEVGTSPLEFRKARIH
jgi:AraC-like DNA-binding protein